MGQRAKCSLSVYMRPARTVQKKQLNDVFSLQVLGKGPKFQPNPNRKYAYKYNFFHYKYSLRTWQFKRKAYAKSIKEESQIFSTFVFRVCFISFVLCLLLQRVTKHILIWFLWWTYIIYWILLIEVFYSVMIRVVSNFCMFQALMLSSPGECDIPSQCDWSYIKWRLGSCLNHNCYIWTLFLFL